MEHSWKQFERTGSVMDYIRYKAFVGNDEENQPVQGEKEHESERSIDRHGDQCHANG